MTRLWKVEGGQLAEVVVGSPKSESIVEDWIARDPSILGLDLLVIARQFTTDFGGRIDLLGMDAAGDLTLVELKRDKTPRDIVAQTLDYGSWVERLTTSRIHSIASAYFKKPLSEAFRERFEQNIPETLNSSHNLLIVASGFDPSSRRIVEYLAETHGVSINTAFFSYFQDGGNGFLASDFLMDQEQVVERSEAKTKAPWTGYYYVNAGQSGSRNWDDMRAYGFIAAGFGRKYSNHLNKLSPGDPIFVYQKGEGYVGYGIVRSPAVMAKDFTTEDGRGLRDLELREPGILTQADDPELSEYLVGVLWKRTFPISEAKWVDGGFANQNVVCKLRDPATLNFLEKAFGVERAAP